MITISRSLLRQVRSVFRRAGIGKRPTGPGSHMLVQSGSDGLRLRGLTFDAAVEYHQPGRLTAEQIVVPCQFLEDCEGRKDQPVVLEEDGPDRVAARFTDGGVPQLLTYQVERTPDLNGFPGMPENIDANEPRLLTALREALPVTDRESSRYALGCIQLRGSQGRLAATDGRHVYRHSGFTFPWTEDLLIPGSNVLRSSEFPGDQQVGIGRADEWIFFVVGFWSVWLRINNEGRFPSIDSIFPDPATVATRVQLSAEDIEFLRQGLGRLPSNDDQHRPVTLDLNGRVAVRAQCPGTPHPTELILSNSQVSGTPLTLSTNRSYLASAISMGFQELCVFAPDRPVLCDDGQRQYLWGLLDPAEIIPPDEQAIRVESVAAGSSQQAQEANPTTPSPEPRRTIPLPNNTNANDTNGRNAANSTTSNGQAVSGQAVSLSPIEQAEALRGTLREALTRTSDLIASLRRQRKQTRLMKTTLDSLKELQRVAG